MKINDITCAINGAIYEVNRILSPGFLEKVYENALLKPLIITILIVISFTWTYASGAGQERVLRCRLTVQC